MESALDRLRDDEICDLMLKNGTRREGCWSVWNRGFYFCDGKGTEFIHLSEVDEWWPASAAF
jgi:hypothetical protein